MQEPWITAYIDENGTNELDTSKQNVSNLFICVAVLVDDNQFETTNDGMKKISLEHCRGAEIANKRIGNNHSRRLLFLSAINKLPFGYYAIVVNKNKIFKTSGLQYKPSFYKNINKMLYKRLAKSGCNLRVVADEIGAQNFMDSFKSYLAKENLPDLFTKFEHSFANSATTPLIQLADLIAGTLSYCFDESKYSQHSENFRRLLQPKEIGISNWPFQIEEFADENPIADTDLIEWLRSSLRNRAIRFIEKFENDSNESVSMQAETLRMLLFAREFEYGKRQAIFSDELIERLENSGFVKLTKQAFSSKIIGGLRDEGIILSGSNEGYRLALSLSDIKEYLKHDKSIMEPMLNRLMKARETVKQDTANRFDILNDQEFCSLKNITDKFLEVQISNTSRRQ